jgi:hypothetical protein
MTTVFVSYRHESDAHRARVRALGARLQAEGINVVLDQFFRDANPAGPNEGWPAWSKNQAANSEKILIVASPGWFRRYTGTEVPGSGLGAAAEGRIIEQRLYDQAGSNGFARLVVFEPADMQGAPFDLKSYQWFDPAGDFTSIVRCLKGTESVTPKSSFATDWPVTPAVLEWQPADRQEVRNAFTRLLTANASHRELLIRAESETGKSYLSRHLLGLALNLSWLACGRFDLKSGTDLDGEFFRFVLNLGVDDTVRLEVGRPFRYRLDAILASLSKRAHPTLIFFDTFEQGGEWARWVEEHALLAIPRAPWLRLVISGQFTPGSLEHKGYARFLSDRFLRLGLPLLAFGLILGPLTVAMVTAAEGKGFWSTFVWLWNHRQFDNGPLWFVQALLMFSLAYCAWRAWFGAPLTSTQRVPRPIPSYGWWLLSAVGVSAAALVPRWVSGRFCPYAKLGNLPPLPP